MESTLDLLAKAEELKPLPEWNRALSLSRNALQNAKKEGHLPPVLAGGLAIELGEDPHRWMGQAVLEGAKDSPAKQRLVRQLMTAAQSLLSRRWWKKRPKHRQT